MSDSRYSYDENAEVWPYFAITLLSVILIPATLIAYSRTTAKEDDQNAYSTSFKSNNNSSIQIYKAKLKRSSLFTKLNLFVFAGWLTVFGLIYVIAVQEVSSEASIFDPYELLDLSYSASEKEIKSKYRQLSLKFHPDKVHDLGNFTQDEVEERFVQITKAYKALTDEEVRENYIKYGHPDGPQSTSHGIALPKWLVEGTGSPIVVSLYAAFFAVVLPLFVGKWWGSIQEYTKNGIHRDTAGGFFEAIAKDQPAFLTHSKILEELSKAAEYKILLPHLSRQDILTLLKAHLDREPVDNELDKLTVVGRAPVILDGYLDIASAFKSTALCVRIVEVRRAIVQAVPLNSLNAGELYQLPGATDQVFTSSISRLPELLKSTLPVASKALGIKETNVTEEALRAAKSLPKITVLSTSFKVPGEEVVPPQSQVHLIIKFAVSSPDTVLPEVDAESLQEFETETLLKNPLSNSNTGPLLPKAVSPYLPIEDRTTWEAFVSAPGDKLVDQSTITRATITKISDPKTATSEDVKINTFKLQLTMMSPQFNGTFNFDLSLVCKTYFGLDVDVKVPMVVATPPEPAPVSDDVYDIPDADEDSLAGAMSQMRGEKTAAHKDDDDDDDEEEEDLSDIDTDTDAEYDTEDEEEDEKEKKTK